MLEITQKNEKLPLSYKVIGNNFLVDPSYLHINTSIKTLAENVRIVCSALNDFEWQVKHKTRSTNRECLLYKINCIWDILTNDFELIWTDNHAKSVSVLDADFDDIMEETRIKSLYKSGEHLRQVLFNYDKQHLVVSYLIGGVRNDK